MNKYVRRWIGAILLLDGLITLFFGKKIIRIFLSGKQKNLFQKLINQLLNLPAWQLRGAATIEAGVGLVLIGKSSLTVPTFYKLVAKGYAAIDPGWRNWFYKQAHQEFDQMISQGFPRDGKILDLGCGVGANVARLIDLQVPFSSYTGVDLTPEMLAQAKIRYGKLQNVHFQQLNLISDPLPEGSYDMVISTWVFEHLPEPVKVANKAWKQLKPGGRMILLFEAKADSMLSRLINRIYPLLSAKLVTKNEYRNFPGEFILEKHFSGPLGDLALLVLEKPETIN
jgi:SAM-dependent methyltransferase